MACGHALDRRYSARPDLARRRPHLPGPARPAAARRASGPAVHGAGLRPGARLPAGCWRSTWTRARGDVDHQAAELGQLLERLGARYVADVARRPAAATSLSCSPRRCRGSSCATSPARWRCGSPRSTRRRCAPSAARSPLPAPGTSAAAGGCSRCR